MTTMRRMTSLAAVLIAFSTATSTVFAQPTHRPPIDGQLIRLVDANSKFAFDLYHILRQVDGNLFCSPHSISQALAMTYAGARGQTAEQMKNTLHYEHDSTALHTTFHRLSGTLASRGQGAMGKDGKGFRLKVVNALWGEQQYSFLPDFLELLDKQYGAELRRVNFGSNSEGARAEINEWVRQQTEDKIRDLLPTGSVTTDTRLVLANAVYFSAAWQNPFKQRDTKDEAFHLLSGSPAQVPTMTQTEYFGYAKGDGWQGIELPYDGRELSMIVLLPDAGTFKEFEATLSADRVLGMTQQLKTKNVKLSMPKFKFDSKFFLGDTLKELGMTDAFDPVAADFSGMDGTKGLHISAVAHKAFVLVDESGTEAAAATGVVMSITSIPPPPVAVKIDRPFVFLIRDIPTGEILFLGRVLSPEI